MLPIIYRAQRHVFIEHGRFAIRLSGKLLAAKRMPLWSGTADAIAGELSWQWRARTSTQMVFAARQY